METGMIMSKHCNQGRILVEIVGEVEKVRA
jgi:hypothetical protein